jgi:uncharacterized membrane protein
MALSITHPSPSSTRYGPESPYFEDRQNLSDRERLGSLIAGGLFLSYGLIRHSVPFSLLGGYLAYRAKSGRCHFYEALGLDSRADADGFPTTFTRSVAVNRPRREVYEFLQATPPPGNGLDLTGDWENELLFWSSSKGNGLETQYAIELEDLPKGGGTVMRAWVSYVAPGAGSAAVFPGLSKPFSARKVERALREVKQILETGEIASTKGQSSGPSLRRTLTNPLWRTS